MHGVVGGCDDESLLAGGVLAQHAAAGARTAVVTATWTADSHRAPELAEALEVLGAGAPRLLGYAATHAESGVGPLGPLLQGVGKSVLAAPDAYVTTTVDVAPWAAVKWAAILAHRSEVARPRSLPGLLARLTEAERAEIICTESFTRLSPGPAPGDPLRVIV
ncbi:PIG-L deacetylase family protein [Streptomyces vinaceus]|uniref:PIG-L deacetylase family protein n=1 Tax=Streptomyces vinaceus TaxID=1960 RepID=UPI0036C321E6